MPDEDSYEPVIGLEVHAQLLTESKLFCGDSTQFGDSPNVHVSAISLGHPGTLPVLNRKAKEKAIKLGLALNCDISRKNFFARKNYFYPDLPKGYQTSQHTAPILIGGRVPVFINKTRRDVQLHHIHLEEDAGKSVHDIDDEYSYIDLNRAGVALLEIVTEPDIFSPDEAFAFLTEIRRIVRHFDICDGNMEQGSLRCDANVSLRKKGSTTLGTRVEIKNLNSIRNVKRAIEFEINRLREILNSGNEVIQETRSFDAITGTTSTLRKKEEADDYRYFADPDLPPIVITDEEIEQIRSTMPSLPHEIDEELEKKYGLSEEAIAVIGADKYWLEYFNQSISHSVNFMGIANWLIGPIKSYLNKEGIEIKDFSLNPQSLASLVDLVASAKVNFSTASTKIFPLMLERKEADPLKLAEELNLLQEDNEDHLQLWIDEVLERFPDKIIEYKKGKKNLIALFAGEVRKKSKGKADMKKVNEILIDKLK